MKLHTKTLLTALTATAALAAGSANAATVLVDVSAAATIANPEDGLYWTSIGTGTNSTVTATDLIDSSNGATPFDLAITTTSVDSGGTSGAGFGGTGVNGPDGSSEPFIDTAGTDDGLFANNDNNGTAVFTFSDLVAGATYDFSAVGGRASGGEDGEIIILDDATPLGAASAGTRPTYALLNDGTVADFSTTANASGEIYFEFRSGGGNNGTGATINALSMTGAVPEPGSLALLGLGGLLIASRRRRG